MAGDATKMLRNGSKAGILDLDDSLEDSSPLSPHGNVRIERVDIYGQTHPAIASEIFPCHHCGRPVMAGKFAPHLSRCMGKGRNSKGLAYCQAQNSTLEKRTVRGQGSTCPSSAPSPVTQSNSIPANGGRKVDTERSGPGSVAKRQGTVIYPWLEPPSPGSKDKPFTRPTGLRSAKRPRTWPANFDSGSQPEEPSQKVCDSEEDEKQQPLVSAGFEAVHLPQAARSHTRVRSRVVNSARQQKWGSLAEITAKAPQVSLLDDADISSPSLNLTRKKKRTPVSHGRKPRLAVKSRLTRAQTKRQEILAEITTSDEVQQKQRISDGERCGTEFSLASFQPIGMETKDLNGYTET